MRFKPAILALLLCLPAAGQSFTVLLQRGIFLEETAGDLDGAIQAYRKILSSGPEARAYESEAQYHLGVCLLRKGNKQLAARSFAELITKHPEEAVLISKATTHYLDPQVGYSFTVPNGWSFRTRLPFGGGPGNCTDFADPEGKATIILCAKPDITPASGIDAKMTRGQEAMVVSRRAGFPDFTLRAGSPSFGWLGRQRTLTIWGDYHANGVPWTDWDTWIETEKTRLSFTVYAPMEGFADVQARVAPILNSIQLP